MKKHFDDLFAVEDSPVYGKRILCIEDVIIDGKTYIKGYTETDEKLQFKGEAIISYKDRTFIVTEDDMAYILEDVSGE